MCGHRPRRFARVLLLGVVLWPVMVVLCFDCAMLSWAVVCYYPGGAWLIIRHHVAGIAGT